MITTSQQNTAIMGLLKAYRLLEDISKDDNHAEMLELEKDIAEIFGWNTKVITKDNFKKNITTIYNLVGIQ